MSLIQGGAAAVPSKSHAGVTIAATSPIQVDPTIPNASTPVAVQITSDYTLATDGGALSRPSACFAGLTIPMTVFAGTRLQLSLCEARALIAAGAAKFG